MTVTMHIFNVLSNTIVLNNTMYMYIVVRNFKNYENNFSYSSDTFFIYTK